jgi:hypothetical protein
MMGFCIVVVLDVVLLVGGMFGASFLGFCLCRPVIVL